MTNLIIMTHDFNHGGSTSWCEQQVALPVPASSGVIGASACDDGIGSVYRK